MREIYTFALATSAPASPAIILYRIFLFVNANVAAACQGKSVPAKKWTNRRRRLENDLLLEQEEVDLPIWFSF